MAKIFADTARRQWSSRWFFPLAALYGALLVPLSMQGMLAESPWIPALAYPAAHARELLYGFMLAIIAGYLLGRLPRAHLAGLLALWLTARAGWLLAPGQFFAAASQACFSVSFALIVAPKFVGRGRKLRNLTVAPLIVLLALSAPVFDYAVTKLSHAAIALSTVLLLAWLMAFMGGRLLAPALAGQLERQGIDLTARVQPQVEGAIIVTLALAALLVPFISAWPLAGCLALAGGLLIAGRLLRWRFWQCHRRLDLWCLCAGYAWLAIGLVLLGLALLSGQRANAVLHAITVGALGTLTINVMLRTHLQRHRDKPEREPLLIICTVLIAVAALIRISAVTPIDLTLAAAAWSAAYLLLTLRLLQ